jgi:capsular exopolysaccharide synthesis family protein
VDNGYPIEGQNGEGSGPNPMNRYRRYLLFLRRFWWIPVITLVLAFGGGAAYINWLDPEFVSVASLWETEKLNLPGGAAFQEDSQTYIGTQFELLRDGRLAQGVLDGLRAAGTNAIATDKQGNPLKVDISVQEHPKSAIFLVSASSANAAYSQAYLDKLLDVYFAYKKEVRKTVAQDAFISVSDQVRRRETDLEAAQDALTSFERTNNMAILQEEGTVSGAYLAKLQTELSDLQLESHFYKAGAVRQYDTNSASTNALAIAAYGTQDPNLGSGGSLQADHLSPSQEIQLLRSQRERLSKNLRPHHPKIIKLDEEIERDEKIIEMLSDASREQFLADREANRAKILADREANRARMSNVLASIKEWEGRVTVANVLIAEADRLKLNVSRLQSTYDRLVQLLQNVDIGKNTDQETLAVLDLASPAKRTHSREINALRSAGFGGLTIGLGLVFLLSMRDDRFNSLSEINEKFSHVIVGQVPNLLLSRDETQIPLLAIHDDRYKYAEAYRNLRSAIFFMPSGGERPKILLVTSALPEEGKSTIAANLARTLALSGSRVLLIDGDLRRGYLHKVLGMQGDPGFADLLQKPEDLDAIIQHDSLPNFSFISRGRTLQNPGDLLFSQRLLMAFSILRERFDYVLIDTCPIFAADDTLSLAPLADGALFVIRNGYSSANAVKEALDLLGKRQVTVLGLVFNRADSSARSYYYYKYPSYHAEQSTA